MARLSNHKTPRLSGYDSYIRLNDPKANESVMHIDLGWNSSVRPGNIGFQSDGPSYNQFRLTDPPSEIGSRMVIRVNGTM